VIVYNEFPEDNETVNYLRLQMNERRVHGVRGVRIARWIEEVAKMQS
jgi:hypothetical protein